LADLLGRLKKSGGADESIRFVELESADVQRSPIVRRILDIYSDQGGPRVTAVVKPAVDKSLVDKSLVDKSLVDKSLVDKSLVDKSLVDKSLVDKSLVDKSLVDKSLVDKSLEKPAVDKSTCAIVQKYRKPSNNDAAMMPLEHISKNMDKLL
jgi:hypothetical protein